MSFANDSWILDFNVRNAWNTSVKTAALFTLLPKAEIIGVSKTSITSRNIWRTQKLKFSPAKSPALRGSSLGLYKNPNMNTSTSQRLLPQSFLTASMSTLAMRKLIPKIIATVNKPRLHAPYRNPKYRTMKNITSTSNVVLILTLL